jgi:putative nucleotidyltransferase with HDIG domain
MDLFEGQKDLKNKIIRAVGNPKQRFQEDALRLLRAVRMAAVLDFEIDKKTSQEIKNNASLLRFVSQERIRDEFLKIILASGFIKTTKTAGSIFKNPQGPVKGIELLRKFGLLEFIIPELLESVEIGQNKHHIYDIYEHLLRSLNYAVKENYNVCVRLAALLHDIAKPRTKKGKGLNSTFYNHEVVGAKMTKKILERLKFSKKHIEKITKLVRYHLFYYNTGEVGESSVRRLMKNVGQENINELLEVRMADRIGSGVPKAEPYKLRHLKYVMEKVSKDPISAKMLKINGNDIMEILKIQPGPKIGQILEILLAEVLENPALNKKEVLIEKIKEIGEYPEQKLEELKNKAMKKVEKVEIKQDEMTKEKYWVS